MSTTGIGLGNPGLNHVSIGTPLEKLRREVILGKVRIGPEAAREIARRVEDAGGFWGPRTEEPS